MWWSRPTVTYHLRSETGAEHRADGGQPPAMLCFAAPRGYVPPMTNSVTAIVDPATCAWRCPINRDAKGPPTLRAHAPARAGTPEVMMSPSVSESSPAPRTPRSTGAAPSSRASRTSGPRPALSADPSNLILFPGVLMASRGGIKPGPSTTMTLAPKTALRGDQAQ
jgi:hypothetical protein